MELGAPHGFLSIQYAQFKHDLLALTLSDITYGLKYGKNLQPQQKVNLADLPGGNYNVSKNAISAPIKNPIIGVFLNPALLVCTSGVPVPVRVTLPVPVIL